MAKQQPSLIERARKFIRGAPALAEARQQLADTEATIAQKQSQLDDALQAEENAVVGVADGAPGATDVRDEARREARRLKDELRDLEVVRTRQHQHVADAETAERAAANAATWDLANQIFLRREQAGARADAAIVDLAEALRAVEHETQLLAQLMGAAVQYLPLYEIRGNLKVLMGEAVDNYQSPLDAKAVAEVVANQHEAIRLHVRL